MRDTFPAIPEFGLGIGTRQGLCVVESSTARSRR
jgi:hypothetical protein